ncbi:MAG: chemotaxis protein CheA [Gammaproteobacteria bacterium]|nr:chemotaxis protein CheA [Gammaproteobacteria bacterium]
MDLKDVVDSFYAESLEGLDLMENVLLTLPPGPVESEVINKIFRAAHSIKGGGGIFGFAEISDFMHGVETVLDQLRNGQREASNELSELLLETVDCVRHMFKAARDKKPVQQDRVTSLRQQVDMILHQSAPETSKLKTELMVNPKSSDWHISFKPHPGMLAKANDPLRMIRHLAELGSIRSQACLDELPPFAELDPTECYLAWEIELTADVREDEIEEVFSWVLDECDLIIKPLDSPAKQAGKSARIELKPVPSGDTLQSTDGPAASESIRVSIDKIDNLINLVGELVITQSMLSRFDNDISALDLETLRNGLSQLIRNTRDLQESVLQIRMLPIRFCFNRFPRLVHDISLKLNKKVNLKLSGEDTELDKTVLECINNPLLHLVRNALDHGLETPEQRRRANKPETGTLELKAYHESGSILIEVIDDGNGLNTDKIRKRALERGIIAAEDNLGEHQINQLIFQAGFTTAEKISDLSGRGVGMDVVKRDINDLGGDVWLESEFGVGTKVSIRLPLTLAILDGQLLRVGSEIYVMPLSTIIETLQINSDHINTLPGNSQVYRLRNKYIPIIRLDEAFNTNAEATKLEDGLLVIVDSERQHYGIWVDELLDQQQVVIKSLVSNFKQVCGVSGATILGDGTVALILDATGIVSAFTKRHNVSGMAVA